MSDIDKLEFDTITTVEQAEAFIELCDSSITKYWLDLVKAEFDLAVAGLTNMKVRKSSVEELGKEAITICATRDAYQSLLSHFAERRQTAQNILEKKGDS